MMDYFRSVKRRLWGEESGQTLTEYALLLALLALAAVGSLTALKGGVGTFYNQIVSALTSAFGG